MAFPTLQQQPAPTTIDIAYQAPILSHEQYNHLNRLVGEAAFDDKLQYRLLDLRDETLCEAYNLSFVTWGYLKRIEADNITDFCMQVETLRDKVLSY